MLSAPAGPSCIPLGSILVDDGDESTRDMTEATRNRQSSLQAENLMLMDQRKAKNEAGDAEQARKGLHEGLSVLNLGTHRKNIAVTRFTGGA